MLLKAKEVVDSCRNLNSWPLIPISFLPKEIREKYKTNNELYKAIKLKNKNTLYKYFATNKVIDNESYNALCRVFLSNTISLMNQHHTNKIKNKTNEQTTYEKNLAKLRQSSQICARGYDEELLTKEITRVVNELNYKFLGIEKNVLVFLTNPIVLEQNGILYYFRPAKIKVYFDDHRIDDIVIHSLEVTNKKRAPKKETKKSKKYDDDEDEDEDEYNEWGDDDFTQYPHVDKEGSICTGSESTKYQKALNYFKLFNAMNIINDGLFSWSSGAYIYPSNLYMCGYLKYNFGYFKENTVLNKMHQRLSSQKMKDERNKIVILFYQAELDGYNIGHCNVADVKKNLLKKQVYNPKNLKNLKNATHIVVNKLRNQNLKTLPKIQSQFDFDDTYLNHIKLYSKFIEQRTIKEQQIISLSLIKQGLEKLVQRNDILCVASTNRQELLILFHPKKKLNIESRDLSYIMGFIIQLRELNIYIVSNFELKEQGNNIKIIHPYAATGELVWGSAETEEKAAELFFNYDYSGLVDLVILRLTNYDDTALLSLDLFDRLIARGTWR
jgi:hypothetical protein